MVIFPLLNLQLVAFIVRLCKKKILLPSLKDLPIFCSSRNQGKRERSLQVGLLCLYKQERGYGYGSVELCESSIWGKDVK